MQENRFVGSRYVIEPIDYSTYTIQDLGAQRDYFLMIDELEGLDFNMQVIIAEAQAVHKQDRYVEFVRETLNLCWYVRDAIETARTVEAIFALLQTGIDVSNPTALSDMCITRLFSSLVSGPEWPTTNPEFIQ